MIHKQHFNIYIASCSIDGGIYHYLLNKKGELLFKSKVSSDRPMYMAAEINKLYVLLRQPFTDSNESGLISYDIADDGTLFNPSEIISTKGEVACHLTVDNETVYVANYISGSVIKMPDILVVNEGKSVHPTRQTSPHTHFVSLTPDKKYVCIVDLGVDTIFVYDKNLNLVSKANVTQGHGARHLAFLNDGKTVFCANELASTISVFDYDDGKLEPVDTYSTLPIGYNGENAVAAIRVYENYLYVSNRGHDSIACYKINDKKLNQIGIADCGGMSPRDFNIIGDYLLCTNENSDNVTMFKIKNGSLIKTNTELKLKNPLCVVFF